MCAAVALTGSSRFSTTCCSQFVERKNIFENPTSFIKNYPNIPRYKERNEISRTSVFYILFFERSYTFVGSQIDQSFYRGRECKID